MTNLLDLPIELLTEVVANVQEPWYPRPSDLKHLRQTCRKLCTLADAIFYHSCNNKDDRKPAQKFLSFTSAVASRSALQKYVKVVDLKLERDYDFEGCTEVWVPKGYDVTAIREAAPSFFEGKLAKKWRNRTTIAVYPHVTALVSLLPNLEVLRLKVKDLKADEDLNRLMDLSPGFLHLKELVLNTRKLYDDKLPSFTLIAPLLRLSTLKRLTLKHFQMADMIGESTVNPSKKFDGAPHPASYAFGSLAIEHLTIRNCPITSDYTIHLIKACRRLVSFDYKEWANIDEDEEGFSELQLDVQSWHDALSLHKDTLVELTLENVNAFRIIRDNGRGPLPVWPSFASFNLLKTFKIEHRRMSYAHLPPNITHLYLFDCRGITGTDELDAWIGIKAYCPQIELFEVMTTQECRIIQVKCKYHGFKWGCWTEQTREYTKAGFELKVWFQDFIDGTYHFSQGTDDTSDVDSDGNKLPHSDEDEDEDEEDEEEEGEMRENNDYRAELEESDSEEYIRRWREHIGYNEQLEVQLRSS